MPGLQDRRKFSAGLKINAPAACTDTGDSEALHANYIVSGCILGQGTTAVVKRARCKKHGYEVAVKEAKIYGDEELGEIMRKEFELMKSLRHPNIVEVYDFYLAPNLTKVYLCMQLIEGESLQSCVNARGKILEETMHPLFEQLVSALAYLHCKRITHRDLKPDNVLVCNSMDKLFICDFNTARKLADGGALTNQVGTMLFAPPEMLLGQGLMGEQADIWSVGMCLYFALSGGSTLATGRDFHSNASFGEYLANASSAKRQQWIASAGISQESSVAQVLWACLNPDAAQRPDATLLLAHPWVTREEDIPSIPHSKSTPMNKHRRQADAPIAHQLMVSDEEEATPRFAHAQSIPMNMGRERQESIDEKRTTALRAQRLCAHGIAVCESDGIYPRSGDSVSTAASPLTPVTRHRVTFAGVEYDENPYGCDNGSDNGVILYACDDGDSLRLT
jgi:serine/threonine protein kinase